MSSGGGGKKFGAQTAKKSTRGGMVLRPRRGVPSYAPPSSSSPSQSQCSDAGTDPDMETMSASQIHEFLAGELLPLPRSTQEVMGQRHSLVETSDETSDVIEQASHCSSEDSSIVVIEDIGNAAPGEAIMSEVLAANFVQPPRDATVAPRAEPAHDQAAAPASTKRKKNKRGNKQKKEKAASSSANSSWRDALGVTATEQNGAHLQSQLSSKLPQTVRVSATASASSVASVASVADRQWATPAIKSESLQAATASLKVLGVEFDLAERRWLYLVSRDRATPQCLPKLEPGSLANEQIAFGTTDAERNELKKWEALEKRIVAQLNYGDGFVGTTAAQWAKVLRERADNTVVAELIDDEFVAQQQDFDVPDRPIEFVLGACFVDFSSLELHYVVKFIGDARVVMIAESSLYRRTFWSDELLNLIGMIGEALYAERPECVEYGDRYKKYRAELTEETVQF